jgi:uncharacterized protein YjbJ (UPF0337 family)
METEGTLKKMTGQVQENAGQVEKFPEQLQQELGK